MIDFIENVCQAGCQKALYCKTYARFQVTLWATEIKKISLVSRSWSTVWINMQKMSNGDYFDEKMRRGDRSKEARRISPPLKLLLKSPKLRGSTAPKSAHLHRGREQGAWSQRNCFYGSSVASEDQNIQNIAKGTTDPRVEFISHDITQIFQFQNLD